MFDEWKDLEKELNSIEQVRLLSGMAVYRERPTVVLHS